MGTLWPRLRNFFKGSFARNASRLIGVGTIAQAVPLAAAPALTRLYAPLDFGALALFTSFTGVIGALATFRLDFLLSATSKPARSYPLLVVSLLYSLIFCAILAAAVALGLPNLLGGARWNALGPLVHLLPWAILGGAFTTHMTGWLVGQGDLKPVAWARVLQSSTTAGIAIVIALIGWRSHGLIIATILGSWSAFIILAALKTTPAQGNTGLMRRKYLKATSRKIRQQVLHSGVAGVANILGLLAPVIMFGYFFNASEVGFYALVQRITAAPIAVITTPVTQTYWSHVNDKFDARGMHISKLFRQASILLVIVATTVSITAFSAPLYMTALFGAEWEPSASVMRLMIPLFFGQIVAAPLAPTLTVLGATKWQMYWDLSRTMAVFLLVYGLAVSGASFMTTVGVYAGFMALMYAVLYARMLILVRERSK